MLKQTSLSAFFAILSTGFENDGEDEDAKGFEFSEDNYFNLVDLIAEELKVAYYSKNEYGDKKGFENTLDETAIRS